MFDGNFEFHALSDDASGLRLESDEVAKRRGGLPFGTRFQRVAY